MPEYSIPRIADEAVVDINERDALKKWMELAVSNAPVSFERDEYDCRRYIAKSIYFKSTDNGSSLYQTGCSPNYFGSLWSLACCKHDMRGNWPVKNDVFGWTETNGDVLEPKQPFFVFTYSRKSEGRQYLASLALVTQGFKSMDTYGEYLLNRGEDTEAAKHRLTQMPDSTEWADRFGDCHYGPENASAEHPHMKERPPCSCSPGGSPKRAYRMDTDGSHVLCVSEPGCWVAWETPGFETRNGSKGQNRWGRPIKSAEKESWPAFYRDLLDEDGWLDETRWIDE